MRTLVKVLFGSRLYGTATPASDTDYKIVHIPSPRDILLHQTKPIVQFSSKTDHHEKNGASDVDVESFALHRFLSLVENGEMIAIELLFAPAQNLLETTPEWDYIVENRHRFLTSSCKGFISYCQRQAAKYGVRGSRVAATRAALQVLEQAIDQFGSSARVAEINTEICQFIESVEHSTLLDIEMPNGSRIKHWEVCNRKLPYTIKLSEAREIMKALMARYGERSLAAEKNEGVDWKAISHAFRVGYQARELLTTGEITFPRAEADFLMSVRRGEMHFPSLQPQLEQLLCEVQNIQRSTKLPDEVDRAFVEDTITQLYAREIANEYKSVF